MSAPTTRAMAHRASILALLAVLLGLVTGCGGGDGTPVEVSGARISADELARSASASGDVESARFAFEVRATVAGLDEPFSLSGSGAIGGGDRASLSLDLSSFAHYVRAFLGGLGAQDADDLGDRGEPDAWKVDAVRDGEVTYLRFPALGGQLPDGTSWIRAEDGSSLGGRLGIGQLPSTGPKTFLELLEGVAGEVEVVGTETLRGAEATHYRATLDPESLREAGSGTGQGNLRDLTGDLFPASELTELPLDVWLDADGVVRKFVLDVTAEQTDGAGTGRATMSFELWDVGETVEIELPPDDQVVDAESVDLGG